MQHGPQVLTTKMASSNDWDNGSIEVSGVSQLTSKETLQYYFENGDVSGGGNVLQISKTGSTFIVTFEDPTVVPSVLKRQHVVDKASLVVQKCTNPPNTLYRRLYVEGLSRNTSDDALKYFMESVTCGGSVKHVEKGSKLGTAVVTFEDTIDITIARTCCQQKTLEKSLVKVRGLDDTSSIIVQGLNDNITNDGLKFYFMNASRSGGGNIELIEMHHGNYAIVHFTDPAVVDSVCSRRHDVFNTTLCVSPYNQEIGVPMFTSHSSPYVERTVETTTTSGKLEEPKVVLIEKIVKVDKLPLKYLAKYGITTVIKTIEQSLRQHQVLISIKDGTGFVVRGTRDGVDKACDQLRTAVEDLENRVRSVRYTNKASCKLFMEEDDDMMLKGLEAQQNCVIDVKKKGSLQFGKVRNKGKAYSISSGNSLKIGNKTIDVIRGNIADEKTDFLVVPCDSSIQLGSGVAKAVRDSAGKSFQDECTSIGKIPDGDIRIVKPGNLKCGKIILAVPGSWDTSVGEQRIRSLLQKCLGAAQNSTSISIPAIGTGYMGFPKDEVARLFFQESQQYIEQHQRTNLKTIRFVVYDKETDSAFRNELQRVNRLASLFSSATGSTTTSTCHRIGRLDIEVVQGDLTLESTNVIVNPVNTDTSFGVIGREIVKHGGKSVQNEYDNKKGNLNNGPIITGAGSLPSNGVIHFVCTNAAGLLTSVSDCLKLAEAKGKKTISFPALGTGGFGISPAESADATFSAISQFTSSSLSLVRIVVFDGGMVNTFLTELNKYATTCGSTGGSTATSVTLGQISVTVTHGDLMKEGTGAIVNPVNTDLSHGVLGKGIIQQGGKEVDSAYNKATGGLSKGAIITVSGNLPCNYIIHFVCTGTKDLEKSVCDCLRTANYADLKSMSFPALGTGGFGIDARDSASSTFRAISGFKTTSLQSVNVVVYDKQMFAKFVDELKRFTGSTGALVADSNKLKIDDKVVLHIQHGDITKFGVGAIVNPVGNGGEQYAVGKAIMSAGGQGIQQEYSKQQSNLKKGPIMTGSGNLKSKNIIHIICPQADRMKNTVTGVLHLAEQRGLRSVAIPAIGTGDFGVRATDAAKEMTDGVFDFVHLHKPTSVKDIYFVIFEKDKVQCFLDQLKYGAMVTLYVYAGSTNEVGACLKAVNSFVDKQIKEQTIQDSTLKSLLRDNKKEVFELADEYCLEIKSDKGAGSVTVKGLQTDVLIFKSEISKLKQRLEMAKVYGEQVKWYYCPDGRKKRQFDGISSAALEGAWFKTAREVFLPIDVYEPSYFIDLKQMTSTDIRTKRSCPVERITGAGGGTIYPKNWKPFSKSDAISTPLLVQLDSSSLEYKEVKQRFCQTASSFQSVVKIQRIQNRQLYDHYSTKLDHFKKKNPKIKNERTLYHGTKGDAVGPIVYNGFNRAYAGKAAGTWFGKGCYFAVNSSYSMQDRYSPADKQGQKWIFQVRVLVGEYTKGSSEMIEPPPKPGGDSNDLYDSVVDDVTTPKAFTIFYDYQFYPDYIITITT
ncbi:protein mono-ADP-ribosyltransferase PARP14-like isoform X2 [Glandiceps talaboti]